jgi:hypothetical protein
MIEDFVIKVSAKAACPVADCPSGELWSSSACTCESMPGHSGELVDTREQPNRYQIRHGKDVEFTTREWSVSGKFKWNIHTEYKCVQVLETY